MNSARRCLERVDRFRCVAGLLLELVGVAVLKHGVAQVDVSVLQVVPQLMQGREVTAPN